jgi:hypothetical protein
VRSTTTREPEWTEQDRGELLALALWRERPCPCGCGNPAALTLLPEDKGPDWVVEESTCTARFALLEQQNAVPESRAKYLPASLWTVRPRKR